MSDELEARICAGYRNLLASVLGQALDDAVSARSPVAACAVAWIATPYAAHLAGLLDIEAWPPADAAYARVRAMRGAGKRGVAR